MAGYFVDCDNKEISVESLFKMLLEDDGTGCPLLRVTVASGVPDGGFDLELWCVQDTNTGEYYLLNYEKDEETDVVTVTYINAKGETVVQRGC